MRSKIETTTYPERLLHELASPILPITPSEVQSIAVTIFIVHGRVVRTIPACEGVPSPHFEIPAARRALGFADLAESASEPKPVHKLYSVVVEKQEEHDMNYTGTSANGAFISTQQLKEISRKTGFSLYQQETFQQCVCAIIRERIDDTFSEVWRLS